MASRPRLISLNNNAGAFVSIAATGPTRQLSMMEDESVTTQGLQVQTILDNFAATYVFSFGSEPVLIPDTERYPNSGPVLGLNVQGVSGAFNFRAADTLVKARSNGGSGTTLRFIEND
jgi:hypothetical protein